MKIIRLAVFGLAAVPAANTQAQDIELPPIDVIGTPIVTGPSTPANGPTRMNGALPVLADSFSSVTVVPQDELERGQYKNLGDALGNKPGISASTFAPGAASRPIIRGLDNFRVRIQENGLAVGDVSSLGEDHAVPLDPQAADQIEVIRGPATLRYGSQAIGGVISATNNRVPMFIPVNGFSATTTTGYSSVDHGFEHSAKVDSGSGNVAVHGDFFIRDARDYAIPGGRQPNSAAEAGGGSLGASYIFANGFVGASITRFDSTYQIPGGEAADSHTRLHVMQDKAQVKGEIRSSSAYIDAVRFWLGASSYQHNEIGTDDSGTEGVRAIFKNREQEARVEVQHAAARLPLGMLTGAVGLQLGHRTIGTSGEAGDLLAPSQRTSIAGYVFEQLALTDTLKLQAAARLEHVGLRGTAADFPAGYLPPPDDLNLTGRSRQFTPFSVSFGILKTLPWDLIGTLNAQYVQRAPDTPELYSKGSHDAPGTFEIGDPNLKIEAAKTIEVGLKRAVGPFRFDASAYYTRYSGFIYKRLTGVLCNDDFASCGSGTDFQQIVYSQQDATFYGAEAAAQYEAVEVWRGIVGIEAQYDYVHARFTDGTNVPRIPPQRAGGGLFYRDSAWFARINLLHAFDHTEIGVNETPTRGYNDLRAEIVYRVKPSGYGFSELELGIAGTNLLNADIRNSASFKKDDILLPGRGLRAHMTLRF